MSVRELIRPAEASAQQFDVVQPIAVSCVVAVPVRNECARIAGCLEALAEQVDVSRLGILLFLNNCTDGTRQIADAWAQRSLWPIRIVEIDCTAASAGWARRQAMEAGAAWLEETGQYHGLLLTTDADSRVAPDWVCRNAVAIAAGADAVAGRLAFDPKEVADLPHGLRERQQLEMNYEILLAEIEARLYPKRGNPWPCHWTKSGASIAVALATYRAVGGMPPLSSGEDHAFIDLIVAHGLVVRHAPEIVVTTSGRLEGRATGGTAETLKDWYDDLDRCCEARLERVATFVVRASIRRLISSSIIADRIPWAKRPLRPHELPRQIRRALLLLRFIRWLEARRYGRRASASGLSPEAPKQLSIP